MRTKGTFAAALIVAAMMNAKAQDWNRIPGGDVIFGGEYLGAAALSTFPLRFTTVPNLRMEWRLNQGVNNTPRMRLMEDNFAGTIEGLEMMRLRPFRMNAADPIEGYVGIGDWVNSGGAPLPDERLDLLDRTTRLRGLPTNT